MTNEGSNRSDHPPEITSFSDKLTPLLADLFYPGESDEPLEPVLCYLNQPEPLTVSQIKDWQMVPPSVYVEEIPEGDFWEPVTAEQDWYGDEEKGRAARFNQLRQFIERELTTRQVFRVGDSEVDVYVLGRQPNGERAGLRTKVIET